jgi:hypothetical protein
MRGFGVGAAIVVVAASGAVAQKAAPADLAAKLSGTWTINRELSPGVAAPGRGGARGGGPAFAVAGIAMQRGGGRGAGDTSGGMEDLTPEERAGIAAMRQLQQIAPEITIKATPESVTFTDARGEQTFTINDKNSNIDVGGARVGVKNKWDKQTLRQEFSTTRSKLIRSWEVDENGRLVLKVKVEGMTLVSNEVKAVFDKQ